jgi:hypothetical protein
MSFDVDPSERYERFLIRHRESGVLFEVTTRTEYDMYTDEHDCENVTGNTIYEEDFAKQTEAKPTPIKPPPKTSNT